MAVKKTFSPKKKANQPKQFLPNYLTIMRKIKSQIKPLKATRTARITFALNANLCQQAEN
jgi:hypothetical protein